MGICVQVILISDTVILVIRKLSRSTGIDFQLFSIFWAASLMGARVLAMENIFGTEET